LKLYVSKSPGAVVLARDAQHARVLLSTRFSRVRFAQITEVDLTRSGILWPPQWPSERGNADAKRTRRHLSTAGRNHR
jgi:hypothetical protein